MKKEDILQQDFYNILSTKIKTISARYLALKLVELNVKKIISIDKHTQLNYTLISDSKKYNINLHQLDLPDLQIQEI